MKILLTGFNSFQGVRMNPSEKVVQALAGRRPKGLRAELITAILSTEYVAATRKLRQLIRKSQPDAVLCLGVAPRRERISLERVALNLDDEETADNAGVVRRGHKITPRGPDVYWSTLPLAAMERAVRRRGIQAFVSNHAGAFLCNHAFYVARQETSRRRHKVPCGFIHLPGLRGKRPARQRSIRRFVRAMECCLGVLARESARNRKPG